MAGLGRQQASLSEPHLLSYSAGQISRRHQTRDAYVLTREGRHPPPSHLNPCVPRKVTDKSIRKEMSDAARTRKKPKQFRRMEAKLRKDSGRTYVKGNLIPGKVIPEEERIFTTWNGVTVSRRNYEVLTTKWNHNGLMWTACSNGKFNSRAVQGGQTKSGEPVYIARARTPGWGMSMGKFVPSKGACIIPWKGKELQCDQYELLCHRRKQRDKSYIYSPSRPYLQT